LQQELAFQMAEPIGVKAPVRPVGILPVPNVCGGHER